MLGRFFRRACHAAGYELRPLRPAGARAQRRRQQQELQDAFRNNSLEIRNRHGQQTREQAAALAKKYEKPVFGSCQVFDLIRRLAECVDPTDTGLFNTSQLVHTLQVVESMEDSGLDDAEFKLVALVHDLGKLLLLTDEAPENITCLNRPIGAFEPGVGLDNVAFPWNHDEFIFSRLKDYLPPHLAWLLRYHSIELGPSEKYMDERDREYCENYLLRFRPHDLGSKSPFRLPRIRLESYRGLVEQAFPERIPF
ncbi:MAG: inositol oxygenase [Gammaproteobacteria bacterium]|nr:inositol oxygenase [Gammaproteobacteria bacterium]